MVAGAASLTVVFVLAYIMLRLSAGLAPQADAYRRADNRQTLGTHSRFIVYDFSRGSSVAVDMVCVKVSRHAAVYAEPALTLAPGLVDRIGTEFDDNIFPLNKAGLAPPALMGLNGTKMTKILLLEERRGRSANGKKMLAGYYTQQNEQLRAYQSASNQAKIVHVFVGNFDVDQDDIMDTVAHETRHLTNWAETRNNVGMAISGLFALATVITLYLGLSHMYLRSFAA